MAFADPLKDVVHRIFRIPREILWGDSDKRDTRTRKILQELGTDFARKFDADVWIQRTIERIEKAKKGEGDYLELRPIPEGPLKVIVPDVRFPNEAQALVNTFEAKLIRLWRPGSEKDKDEGTTKHASETSIDDIPKKLFTHTLLNNGTKKDAIAEAQKLVGLIDD
jgi:hypothetical protein